tara:strand:+ start:1853 stop:2515 length:663 start_codon:yes stop_codon:yes gene_type:complete
MNREQYNSDPRYAKILEQMDLLGIMDISTTKQRNNGTIVWKLPIKDLYCQDGSAIHVASYKSGYVRRLTIGKGTSDYQLNKRIDGEPEYFESGKKDSMGRTMYTRFTTRTCKLIPIEIDRLEYLITYCLKNYYIGHANKVARSSDEYVPKWYYENMVGQFLKCKDTDDMINFEYSGGQIRNMENGDVFVHEQHAYWSKWEEDSPANSVELIIDGHRYKVK